MYRQNWCVSWWCCRFSSVWRCFPWLLTSFCHLRLIQCRTTWPLVSSYLPAANCWMKSTVNWRQVKRVYARWNVMSLPILSRYVAVSVNCEESYEYSLATGRAKGEAWFQISRQAGTSYRTALWPGGCGGLGDKISCSPTAENVAGCGAGTAVKSGCQ